MKYIDAEEITPIMAEYVADVFSRKEHLDDISYGYCMEIAETFRRYAERAKQEQLEMEQEEKKLPEGLEEAAEKSASQYYVDGGYSPFQNVETAAHEAGFIAGAEWMKSKMPKWYKVEKDGMLDKPTRFILAAKEGYFFCNGDCISRDGYAIFVDELEKLPKEDEK